MTGLRHERYVLGSYPQRAGYTNLGLQAQLADECGPFMRRQITEFLQSMGFAVLDCLEKGEYWVVQAPTSDVAAFLRQGRVFAFQRKAQFQVEFLGTQYEQRRQMKELLSTVDLYKEQSCPNCKELLPPIASTPFLSYLCGCGVKIVVTEQGIKQA